MTPSEQPFLIDIGNVLCTFDFDPMLDTLAKRSDKVGADPLQRFAETKDLYESGQWSDREFVDYVIKEIGFHGEHSEFEALWTGVFEENTPMTSAVRALSERGHPLYLLSNTNGLHLDFLRATFPIFEVFDGGIFSHEAGSIKPQDRIYEIALETYSLDAESTFYVDDLPDNIATGERFGLISHRYDPTDHAAFTAWLSARGIELG